MLGEVIAVHIDRAYLADGVYEAVAARPIVRWGGRGDYARISPGQVFEMVRPTAQR